MANNNTKKIIKPEQRVELFTKLEARFHKKMDRHKGFDWEKIQIRLNSNPEKLWTLNEMEKTGGEPDVIGRNKKTDEYVF